MRKVVDDFESKSIGFKSIAVESKAQVDKDIDR